MRTDSHDFESIKKIKENLLIAEGRLNDIKNRTIEVEQILTTIESLNNTLASISSLADFRAQSPEVFKSINQHIENAQTSINSVSRLTKELDERDRSVITHTLHNLKRNITIHSINPNETAISTVFQLHPSQRELEKQKKFVPQNTVALETKKKKIKQQNDTNQKYKQSRKRIENQRINIKAKKMENSITMQTTNY